MLPVVSKELKGSIIQSIKSDYDYVKSMFSHMKNMNPALYSIMMGTAYDEEAARENRNWVLTGGFIGYAMLVAQDECDEMSK